MLIVLTIRVCILFMMYCMHVLHICNSCTSLYKKYALLHFPLLIKLSYCRAFIFTSWEDFIGTVL